LIDQIWVRESKKMKVTWLRLLSKVTVHMITASWNIRIIQ
jgi:hypothetical protein